MLNILIGILLLLSVFGFYRSWKFMQGDAVGPDAVALYAASVLAKQFGYLFLGFAGLTTFLQWTFT